MSKRCGLWFVYRCLLMGGKGGLWWPVPSEHWLFYTGCWRYLLSMKWLMYGLLFLHFPTSLWCLCPRTIFDLLYIRFTYHTKDNQRECSRLYNWFSLRCLATWRNHLPPVWWSTFRFSFLNVNCCVSLVWWTGICLLVSCLYSCFIHYPVLPIISPVFLYKAFCTVVFDRRSRHFFQ